MTLIPDTRPTTPTDNAPTMFYVPNSQLQISGGTFTNVGGTIGRDPRKLVQEYFRNYVAVDARHDTNTAVDPPRCHPGTRETVLETLEQWTRDTSNESICWIYGPAGSGKTAIARSLSERSETEGLLAASFFFSRSAPRRNNEKFFIPTIAYQMALSIPEIQNPIATAVEQDPFVFELSLRSQMLKLIIEPVISISRMDGFAPSVSKIIIIDGLDECGSPEAQNCIIAAISEAIPSVAGRLKFLILSRREYHIDAIFRQPDLNAYTRSFDLKHDKTSHDDVRLFLCHKFDEIKGTHPLKSHIDPLWPSNKEIDFLGRKSWGNFIYPHTVMAYIAAIRDRPQRRLKVILDLLPTSETPYAKLDDLYRCILSRVKLDRASLLRLLGALVLCYCRATSNAMTDMSMLRSSAIERELLLEPGDLSLKLVDLCSLIALEDGPSDDPCVEFMHPTFPDFLLDSSRSGKFCVDPSKAPILSFALDSYVARSKPTPTLCTDYWPAKKQAKDNVARPHVFVQCRHRLRKCLTDPLYRVSAFAELRNGKKFKTRRPSTTITV